MSNASPKTSNPTSHKKTFILGGALALMAIIFFAFFLPFSMDNGTEELSADQKEVAKAQLEMAPRLLDATDRFASMTLKYRVESVYQTPNEQLAFWCGSNIDANKTYYSVVIGEYSLFGIKVGEFSRHDACALMNE